VEDVIETFGFGICLLGKQFVDFLKPFTDWIAARAYIPSEGILLQYVA
jgi:hypothetical protein